MGGSEVTGVKAALQPSLFVSHSDSLVTVSGTGRMLSVTLTSYETSPPAARQPFHLKPFHLKARPENGKGWAPVPSMQQVPYRRLLNDRNGFWNGVVDYAVAVRANWRLPGSRPYYRLFMLLPIVFLVTLIMAVVQIMGDSDYFERLQGKESQPLYDLGHVLLPDLNDESKLIAEIPLFAMLALTIIISLTVEPDDRTRLLRRFTVLQCIMYLFRTLSLLGTRLPPSDPSCTLRRYEGMSVVTSALRIVFLLDSACTDMIFSGHTAAATSMVAVWIFHDRVHWIARTVGVVNLILCGFGFVASRLHYTVDVVVAFIIAALLASCYSTLHQLVKLNYPSVTKSTPVLATIIHWIEGYDLLDTSNSMIKAKRKYLFDLNTPHES